MCDLDSFKIARTIYPNKKPTIIQRDTRTIGLPMNFVLMSAD